MLHFFRLVLIFVLFVGFNGICAQADGIVIQNGANLSIAGGDLHMNCLPLTVKNGGTLSLEAGEIDLVVLTVEPGGSFDHTGGVLDDGDVDGADLVEFIDDFNVADLPAFASDFGQKVCN